MHIDDIGSFALNLIKSKARKLIGNYGFTWSDFENLQQDMIVDLLERLPKFNPERSPRNAFITLVVSNKVAEIIKERMSPSRKHVRGEVSIHAPLQQDDRPGKLADVISDPSPSSERSDLAMELEQALAGLPVDLRSLWNLRVQGLSLTEISLQTGTPRPTLYDRWGRLREHFERAGLDKYFKQD